MGQDVPRTPSISAPLNFAACRDAALSRRPTRWLTGLGAAAAAAIASVGILGTTILPAKAQFTALYGFGDSYADTGAAPGGAFQLGHLNCIYSPNCTFTGSTTFVQSLQSIYGLLGMTNYSIGGARTDNTNTLGPLNPGFGFSYQLAQSAGVHYASSDLIALSIGGNDLSAIINLTGVAVTDRQLIVSGAT